MATDTTETSSTPAPVSSSPGVPSADLDAEDLALPEGFEIGQLTGKAGRPLFAVYVDGRRVASGMTTARSAARWAHLLAAARPAIGPA